MKRIIKVKNFEGYEYFCCKCGRSIKHVYRIEGDNAVYGSECIYAILGYGYKKQIKNLDNRMKVLDKMINQTGGYGDQFYAAMEDRKYTREQMADFYLQYGHL